MQIMDNQAFHSSRDSNLSSEIPAGSPQRNTSTKPYHNSSLDPMNIVENGLETQQKNYLQDSGINEISVPYSEVPLIDALQNNSKTIHVQECLGNSSTPTSFNNNVILEEERNDVDNAARVVNEIKHRNDYLHSNSRGDVAQVVSPLSENLQDTKILHHRSTSTQLLSRSVQVWPTPPYRLRVLPRSKCAETSMMGYIGRCIFCQVGLSILLFAWAVVGALAFHYTEGPAEIKMVAEQKALVDNLVQELMHSPRNDEALWHKTVERYMYRHEIAWSDGGKSTDISDRSPGRVWSLPGCTLFAVSLITTLGFGAPVPRTSEGRAVAVVFAAVGIPLHLILVLNIGMVLAVKLQKFATRNKKNDGEILEESEEVPKNDNFTDIITNSNGLINRHRRSGSEPIGRQAISNITREANFIISDGKEHKYQHIPDGELKVGEFKTSINNFLPVVKKRETSYEICAFKSLENLDKEERRIFKNIGSQPNKMPMWLKWLPFIGIAVYYTTGVSLFGFLRGQNFLDSLMFPLDFTVAGGVAHTEGYIRVLYGIYLEGAVVIAASTVSILQVTATNGFTELGLKFGLLTNSR